jgi:hypothetical protein
MKINDNKPYSDTLFGQFCVDFPQPTGASEDQALKAQCPGRPDTMNEPEILIRTFGHSYRGVWGGFVRINVRIDTECCRVRKI